MLSERFKYRSIPMCLVDSYTIANIINKNVLSIYSNTEYMLKYMLSSTLWIWVDGGGVSATPHNSIEPPFPYSTKELLTYLYDKIESK
jgi:hypothetical protein